MSGAKRKREPHPFQVGDRVRLNGKGPIGFPLSADRDYTVSKTFYGSTHPSGENDLPEHDGTPGVMLSGNGGYFFAFRFSKVDPLSSTPSSELHPLASLQETRATPPRAPSKG